MIIYGRLLSTFTRRTLIWATLQDRGFEHRPIQVVGEEFEDLIKVHPGGRVPAVELPDGTVLVDSAAIIDYLEFSAPIDMRLMPQDELSRRQAAALFGHATAGAEKATAHFYETNRRPEPYRWAEWADRLARQVGGSLDVLEAACPDAGFYGGTAPNGVDVGVVPLVDFIETTNPALMGAGRPKLKALAARANALPAFEKWHPKHM